MLIDEEFDFLIASLALCVGIFFALRACFFACFFALRAIASLRFALARNVLRGAVLLAQNCAGIILAFVFLGSLCGAKLGFGGKPLL